MNHFEDVVTFTRESMGKDLPSKPEEMTMSEIEFISAMIMSELAELVGTLETDPAKIKTILATALSRGLKDLKPLKKSETMTDVIADQLDAFIDIDYYCKNACAKKGWPYNLAFNEVHRANMDKKFPDGKFKRREDGKVIKPDGWKERDIRALIRKHSE